MSKNKKLYKIGEITKKLNITPRTIRYYDQLGILPNIKRSDGFTRIFDHSDISIIEKTRYYQKYNFLPLFEIKSKLFPTHLNKYKVCLLTDSISKEKYNLPKEITSINADLKSKKIFSKKLNDLSTKSKTNTIIIYFYDPENKHFFKEISKQKDLLPKIKFYPIIKNGYSTHMIINHIYQNINKINTLEELNLLIEQFIDLTFNLGILDTINHYFPKETNSKSEISNELSQFNPIFYSSDNLIEIRNYNTNKNTLISILIEEFEIELLKRKRYVKKIEIFALNNIELAKKLKEKLAKKYTKINTQITPCKSWPFNGKKGIIITLI